MTVSRPDLEVLAGLLSFPGEDLVTRVQNLEDLWGVDHPVVLPLLEAFRSLLLEEAGGDVEAWRDGYMRCFEIQAITTLDLGFLVFGDDYKRAELLVELRREQLALGLPDGPELADHLPVVLRLLARSQDTEMCADLVALLVRPALQKMVLDFEPGSVDRRDALYRKHHKTLLHQPRLPRPAYRLSLQALLEVLDAEYEVQEVELPRASASFLEGIGREMDIENRFNTTGGQA